MIRIVASGDQHVGALHMGTAFGMTGKHTALHDQERALDELVSYAIAATADALVLLGDLTHTARPSPDVFSIWGRALANLEDTGVTVVAIAGNHDRDAVVEVLQNFRGVSHVITTPTLLPLIGRMGDRYDLACLPWLPDAFVRAAAGGTMTREQTAQALTRAAVQILEGFVATNVGRSVPLILATHATIAGAQTESGWNMGYAPSTSYVLPLEALEPFDVVLAGHIHKAQRIGTEPPNASATRGYTGSLVPLDFSETDPKGFLVATLKYGVRSLETLEYGTRSLEFVPVRSTPRVVTFDLTGDEHLPEHFGDVAGALVRVRATVAEDVARTLPPSRIAADLYGRGARLAQVEYTVTRPDRARTPDLDATTSPLDALATYLGTNAKSDDELNHTVLIHQLGAVAVGDLHEAADMGGGAGDLDVLALEAIDFLGLERATVKLHDVDVAALVGPVGAGKSSIGCDVARFALFGESRLGAKASERLIRQGADLATVSVRLGVRPDHCRLYEITRKLRRGSGGRVTSMLDVHTMDRCGDGTWQPISSGKVAEGQAAIARLLGGLTDEVVTAANFVIQRQADTFTRARPEERKRLIAQAAGLDVYDDLAQISAERRLDADRALERLHATAEPLRARAEALPRLQEELARENGNVLAGRVAVTQAEERALAAAGREDDLRIAAERFASLAASFRDVDAQRAKIEQTTKALTDRAIGIRVDMPAADFIAQAQIDILAVRAEIVELEARHAADASASTALERALRERDRLKQDVATMIEGRRREAANVSEAIERAQRQRARLADAHCPVMSDIDAKRIPPCALIAFAVNEVAKIPALEERVAATAEATAAEGALAETIRTFPLPEVGDVAGTAAALFKAREKARRIESILAQAGRLAAAQATLAEIEGQLVALARDDAALLPVWTDRRSAIQAAQAVGPDPRKAHDAAFVERSSADEWLKQRRRDLADIEKQAAILEGRIQTMQDAVLELRDIDRAIVSAAVQERTWGELVTAWRGCRVAVLENSVIPAIEDLANDALRQFPYGLAVRFATQREKLGGGIAETLEIEVLGPGQVYELCSGGQKTVIDLAFHIALALVVSRRSSTRLRFLYLDEPEGLDGAGRVALARLVRRIHTEHGLTVLVASHHDDLVEALGGTRIDIGGVPGAAVIG